MRSLHSHGGGLNNISPLVQPSLIGLVPVLKRYPTLHVYVINRYPGIFNGVATPFSIDS